MAIHEPEARKRYPLQPSSYRGPRGAMPPGRRKRVPSASVARVRRGATLVITRLSQIARQHREARILDALAGDAIREHRAGQTRNLRDVARQRNIALNDE